MSKIRSTRKSRRIIRNNRRYFLMLALIDYGIFDKMSFDELTRAFYEFGVSTKRYSLTIKDFCKAVQEAKENRDGIL